MRRAWTAVPCLLCKRGAIPNGVAGQSGALLSPVQRGSPSRTLMRPPVVKSHTAPRRGFLLFSALQGLGVVDAAGVCPDWIAVPRCTPTWLHHTRMEALSPARARAEQATTGALRPRNKFVPSNRPLQERGGTGPGRQFEPGAGAGQPTETVDDDRRIDKSQRGRPIQGQGSGRNGLCPPAR